MPRVADMLARVGLKDKANAYPVELSGGQAQRVSVARAFLHPSKLLLMDEPFSSLDTALKIRLMSLFGDIWREERRTVLFVTQIDIRIDICLRTAQSCCAAVKSRQISIVGTGVSAPVWTGGGCKRFPSRGAFCGQRGINVGL